MLDLWECLSRWLYPNGDTLSPNGHTFHPQRPVSRAPTSAVRWHNWCRSSS